MNIVFLLQLLILLPAFVLQTSGDIYLLGAIFFVGLVLHLSYNTVSGYQKKEFDTLGWISIAATPLVPVIVLSALILYFSSIKYLNIRLDDETIFLIIDYLVIIYYVVTTTALGSFFEKEKGAFDLVFIMVFGSINALTCFFFIRLIFETVNEYINLLF